MRIVIDAEKCQGHALCWRDARALVELDDHGFAHPRSGVLTPADVTLARRAAINCPERAITIEESPSDGHADTPHARSAHPGRPA